ERRDRRAAVPQPANGGVAPAQGVREARRQLAEGARRSSAAGKRVIHGPSPRKQESASGTGVRPIVLVDLAGQLEDLPGERQQVLVLLVLLLHGLPLLVGEHLALGVGAVLTDHHERR